MGENESLTYSVNDWDCNILKSIYFSDELSDKCIFSEPLIKEKKYDAQSIYQMSPKELVIFLERQIILQDTDNEDVKKGIVLLENASPKNAEPELLDLASIIWQDIPLNVLSKKIGLMAEDSCDPIVDMLRCALKIKLNKAEEEVKRENRNRQAEMRRLNEKVSAANDELEKAINLAENHRRGNHRQ